MEVPRVIDFYRGATVFLTGGTGFIGKAIVEKLLYSCPNINKIYVFVREHKGATPEQRFNNIFQSPLFSRLKSERPEALHKVVLVAGDLVADRLFADDNDKRTLLDEVTVVYHVAATIKFNEPLKYAMAMNVEGTRKVLELCRQMKKLQSVVHVSTAFMNPHVTILEEKFYPFPMREEELTLKLNADDFSQDDEIRILADWPNAYVFTKALTESVISGSYTDLPLVVVRPSIVTAMRGDPLPGWIESWAGATAMVYSYMKGFDRVLYGEPNNLIDFIPVDDVTNVIIAAATRCKRRNVGIYNICTSSTNPLTVNVLVNNIMESAKLAGHCDFYYPFVIVKKSKFIEQIVLNITKWLCYLGDLTSRMLNKSPRYLKAHSNVVTVHNILRYFTGRSWTMESKQSVNLYQTLHPEDKELFHCDTKSIHWRNYARSYCDGIETYLVKKVKSRNENSIQDPKET